MTQTFDGLAVSRAPVLFHRPPRELVVLGAALIFLCAIYQMNDVADLFEQIRKCDASLLCVLVKVYPRPCATGKTDLLRPHIGIEKIARQFSLCVPEIDLEGKRISPRTAIEYPLQGCVGNEPSIPIVLAIDFGRRKARRQRAAGDDMRWADPVGGGVEIDEISGPDVDRADG